MRPKPTCKCGCGRHARTVGRYAAECSPVKDPAWRKARSADGGRAATEAKRAAWEATLEGLTPLEAGRKGYLLGYKRAWQQWKRWAERAVAQARRAA